MNPANPVRPVSPVNPAGLVNTADWLLESGAGPGPVLADGSRRYTYDGLRDAVAVLQRGLLGLGLAPGARVGLLGPNSFFWIAGYLAVLRSGLVAVPLPAVLRPVDARRNLDLAGCCAVLADAGTLARSGSSLDGLAVISGDVLGGGGGGGAASGGLGPAAPVGPDDDAALMFTSGSTAGPKAVRVTHRNLQANTTSILGFLPLTAADRVLVILPFSYCYGASLLHTHLRRGASLVLLNSFVFPQVAMDVLEREQCTVLAGVPSSFRLLLRAGGYASRPLPALRLVQAAGGRLEPAVADALAQAQPGAELYLMYGQTEATARLSYLPPAERARRPGSIGRGIPGVGLQVLDDEGRPVPPGVTGEIYARGENISPGYDGDPEATAAKFTPHGLRTGDLAVVDDEGWITVTGRRDDFIKSWGHRISCSEVEACARSLPGVGAAAAVGVPDEAAGEALVLFVTLDGSGAEAVPAGQAGLDEQAVLAHCGANLARHMVPRAVIAVPELPLTSSGKVAKLALRDLALARR